MPVATSPIEAVLAKLPDAKALPSGGFIARCPGHEDRSPSLKVDADRDGKVLLHCYAGCEPARIVDALGMTLGDLFPPDPARIAPAVKPVPSRELRWEIRDVGGSTIATHVRKELPEGKKFLWQRPGGEWGLGGIKTADLPLYGVHELGDSTLVVVAEGEKARDAVARCGLGAVGTVTGASSAPGGESLRPLLGRTVVLWPDRDAAGEGHMGKVAAGLVALGQVRDKVRRVAWEGAPPQGDAADFTGTADELRRLVAAAAPWWPEAQAQPSRRVEWTAAELLATDLPEPRWAVPDLIPEGLTILAGRPKKGKSRLALDLALTVASGLPALGHFEIDHGGDVLFAGLEDGPRRLQERLEDMLGKRPAPPTLHLRIELPKLGEGCEEWVERWIAEHPNARLIWIDTYQRVRKPQTGRDGNPYAIDYGEAARLQTIAMAGHIAVGLILHTRKPVGGLDPFDDVLGSTGNTAAADALMLLQTEMGKADAKLLVTGRDIEQAEHALTSDPVTGRWTRIGAAADVRRTSLQESILAALRVAGDAGLRPVEIATHVKQRGGSVRMLLHRMRNNGEVYEKEGRYLVAGGVSGVALLRSPENPHGDAEFGRNSGAQQSATVLRSATPQHEQHPQQVQQPQQSQRPPAWVCECGTEVIGHLAHCLLCGRARP